MNVLTAKSYKLKARNGFTLLEALLSLATIAIIAGTSISLFQPFQNRNDADLAAATAAQTLRRAQALAEAVDGDTGWGVRVQNGSITLFQGTSYASRDSSLDEIFDVPTTIAVSGTQEFVFTKFTGLPQATGSVMFLSPNAETRTVTINGKGTVSY